MEDRISRIEVAIDPIIKFPFWPHRKREQDIRTLSENRWERNAAGVRSGYSYQAFQLPHGLIDPPQKVSSLAALEAWGETIGVSATMFKHPKSIELNRIDRHQDAPKGRGAMFMQALCAYADHRHQSVYLTVTGGNNQLETYYSRFGFVVDEATRDDETGDDTGDVVMIRSPIWLAQALHA